MSSDIVMEKDEREGKEEKGLQDRFLTWMYGHLIGRLLLRPMVSPWFSKLGGKVLDSRLSVFAIKPFVRKNQIDLTGCEKISFSSYNDFFTRKLNKDMRPIPMKPGQFISPCDGRLSVYPITYEGRFSVKHTEYTVDSLLQNHALAQHFVGGTLWLFRLCVDDYHRYIYPVSGRKSRNIQIPGVFHTVNPVANDCYPIYKENTREYCLIKTPDWGTVLQMEVGAMLVGKIENASMEEEMVVRGQEKGNFAFGGSTIIVMTQAGAAVPDELFVNHTAAGIETKVRMGERVGGQ